jgi:mRNA interferase MazF
MARFIKGDVVIIPFPFSDLSASKRRPALVLADLAGNDIVLCQITSQQVRDADAIELADSDMVTGSLKQSSNIRPNRLFTADKAIIVYKVGSITTIKFQQVRDKIVALLDS